MKENQTEQTGSASAVGSMPLLDELRAYLMRRASLADQESHEWKEAGGKEQSSWRAGMAYAYHDIESFLASHAYQDIESIRHKGGLRTEMIKELENVLHELAKLDVVVGLSHSKKNGYSMRIRMLSSNAADQAAPGKRAAETKETL